MKNVVIVGMARTAIGTFNGTLKNIHPAELGSIAIKEAVNRAGLPFEEIDEVIIGSVGQYAENAFLARMCALQAGVPNDSNAYTVNRLCGSGLQAINNGVQEIQTGNADVVVAGGTENMDLFPYYVRKGRYGYTYGHGELEDGLLTALTDPFGNYPMGMTAEAVADKFNVSRQEQDEFAHMSQQRAKDAIAAEYFKEQIVPIEIEDRRGNKTVFDVDEHPRDVTVERLGKLRPAFKENGSVTAGNSSGINTGAAALVLMSEEKCQQLGLVPLATIKEQAVAGLEPEIMGFAPAPAIEKVLKKSNLSLDDIDLIELNEAFASQSVAVINELNLDINKVNVNGGAIALGHPIGASGAIITVKLISELHRRKLDKGIATMCIGGGQGIATLFEIHHDGVL